MSRAAIRYAKAILQHANDVKVVDEVFGDMKTVQQTIDASKELRLVLKSPIIKAEDKKQALLKIFADQSNTTHGLIELLVDKKRSDILGQVAASYVDLYNDSKGVKVAHVTTAVPLSSGLEQTVLEKVKELTGSERVTLENMVDETIIGGFILRVGDIQYNASIANKLGKIKREFSKSI